MSSTELLILRNLVNNEEYTRKVLPHLKSEYFQQYSEKVVFEEIIDFIGEYNKLPNKDVLEIELNNREDLNETTFKECLDLASSLDNEPVSIDWLYDTTEKWCRDRAIYNALMKSIQIADGKSEKMNRDAIPSILEEALSVSFDNHIGHDFLNDSDARFEYYNNVEAKIPFDIEYLNRITRGGVTSKTLNVIMSLSNVGKSLIFTSFASSYLKQGKNVLYITLEMAEEEIAKRIDANCLDISIDEIHKVSKKFYDNKFSSFKTRTQGNLIIKEYPTAGASVIHFKSLINELQLKKHFKPDIIVVDYLGICASSRLKKGAANSYEYVGAIAEELRGFAKEVGVPLWTGVQVNRENTSNADPSLAAISESAKIGHVSDFVLAVISTEELEQMGQYLCKQVKNRYNRKGKLLRFTVGVDYEKMRLYDVEQSQETNTYYEEEDFKEEKPKVDYKDKFKTFTY